MSSLSGALGFQHLSITGKEQGIAPILGPSRAERSQSASHELVVRQESGPGDQSHQTAGQGQIHAEYFWQAPNPDDLFGAYIDEAYYASSPSASGPSSGLAMTTEEYMTTTTITEYEATAERTPLSNYQTTTECPTVAGYPQATAIPDVTPGYPPTYPSGWNYESMNATYSQASASGSVSAYAAAATHYTNAGNGQQQAPTYSVTTTTVSSFSRRWSRYSDPARENDPLTLQEHELDDEETTLERARNKITFNKEIQEAAFSKPYLRRFKLRFSGPEDFGCPWSVTFSHRKPWKVLKYPRDKSKDTSIQFKNIHFPAGVDYEDWGDLIPGRVYQVARDEAPTPNSILEQLWGRPHDLVIYIPRPFEYSEAPTISILCSYKGTPGPNVWKVARRGFNPNDLDDYNASWIDKKFDEYEKYVLLIQWPGYQKETVKFARADRKGVNNEYRHHLVKTVCSFVWSYISDGKNGKKKYTRTPRTADWRLKNPDIDIRKVRLMAINYYRHIFFPILALDVTLVDESVVD